MNHQPFKIIFSHVLWFKLILHDLHHKDIKSALKLGIANWLNMDEIIYEEFTNISLLGSWFWVYIQYIYFFKFSILVIYSFLLYTLASIATFESYRSSDNFSGSWLKLLIGEPEIDLSVSSDVIGCSLVRPRFYYFGIHFALNYLAPGKKYQFKNTIFIFIFWLIEHFQ